MTAAEHLLRIQSARLTALDPLLPEEGPTPDGHVLTTALPNGRRVAGVVTFTENPPGSQSSLWSARWVWELHPVVGSDVVAGLDALARAWRAALDRGDPNLVGDADSSCLLSWPSRDVEATRTLLDHGFVPLSVLAVRVNDGPERDVVSSAVSAPVPAAATAGPAGGSPADVRIRRARLADLDAALDLSLAELAYSALVGGTIVRPDAAELKRESIGYRLRRDDPVWLAEQDGLPVALAECGFAEVPEGAGRRFMVTAGRWGYVNTLSVSAAVRDRGVGQRIMAVAHRELRRAGAVGTYLYYNPANPLSSVFWPRQGYRPLWTIWEVRPAGALR
ncbi:MAG TPA: GNAT family N-acetyltransferase [Pseudonocardiaceae bacterium]